MSKRSVNLLDLQRAARQRGEIHPGYETYQESLLGSTLLRSGIRPLGGFDCNGWSFDIKIESYPLLIEVDGAHHRKKSVRIKDYRKDREAARLGFTVLRYGNQEVEDNPEVVAEEIRAVIAGMQRQTREVMIIREVESIGAFCRRMWSKIKKLI